MSQVHLLIVANTLTTCVATGILVARVMSKSVVDKMAISLILAMTVPYTVSSGSASFVLPTHLYDDRKACFI